MKHHRQELWFNTPDRRGYINITPEVRDAVTASGVQHGLCLVNAMHITASVYINDDEPGLIADYDDWLEKLAPFNAGRDPASGGASGGGGYRHNRTGEDNADAHMKRQVMGRSVTIAISDGELDFGPWEQVFYAEFDGRRKKRALIKIIGA